MKIRLFIVTGLLTLLGSVGVVLAVCPPPPPAAPPPPAYNPPCNDPCPCWGDCGGGGNDNNNNNNNSAPAPAAPAPAPEAPAPAPADNTPQAAFESFFDWGPPPPEQQSCNDCWCGGPCESRWDYYDWL